MERVKIISLAALLVSWAGLLVFRGLAYPEPQRVPLQYTSGQKSSPQAAVIAAPVPSLSHWPAIRRPELPSPTLRNIFAPLPKPRIAHKGTGTAGRSQSLTKGQAPQRQKTGTGTPSASQSPAPVVYTPPPPPPAPPPPSPEEIAAQQERARLEQAIQQARQQMTQYRFLGYLTRHGEPIAFLGKGQELFIVRAGEVVEAQIHVAGITEATLTLRDAASQVEHSLPLPKDAGP